ncbi:MAG: hypothetical protein E7620_07180 [Ruminococcaceae bacterium]|nr:hypothetical protein [Oscillospiraceae bacterium]
MSFSKPISLEAAVTGGKLKSYLSRYLESCQPPPNADPKKGGGRFPNLAGFCRWLGCGISEVEALRLTHPVEADRLCAVMEDEALNTALLSPTVISAYLKRRLGYGDKPELVSGAECGEMRVIFEHDVFEDGA